MINKIKKNIAIGSTGSSTGFGAVDALLNNSELKFSRVFACDINPAYLIAASHIADGYIRLPQLQIEDQCEAIAEMLLLNKVDVFYPIHDKEIKIVATNKHIFDQYNIIACCSDEEAVMLSSDKLLLASQLKETRITYPETTELSDCYKVSAPVIIKPKSGVGSKDTFKIFTQAQFDRIISELKDQWVHFIIQKWYDEPEVTVDCFVDPERNFVRTLCRQRLETKAGVVTKARVYTDESCDATALALADHLGLRGAFCYQFRTDHLTGSRPIIDINPRIGGGTAMSVKLGMNFPVAHINYFLGYRSEKLFLRPKHECYVTRSYSEHIFYI